MFSNEISENLKKAILKTLHGDSFMKVWNFREILIIIIINLSTSWYFHQTEALARSVLSKKVLLNISQNLHENTCARVFF